MNIATHARWTAFSNLWLSIGAAATVDHNRRVSAAGHAATIDGLDCQCGSPGIIQCDMHGPKE